MKIMVVDDCSEDISMMEYLLNKYKNVEVKSFQNVSLFLNEDLSFADAFFLDMDMPVI